MRNKGGRPKLTTHEVLDISDLHLDWDSNSDIRDRLSDGKDLLDSSTAEDITSSLSNVDVLQPLITRMSLTQHRPLPGVDALRDEIEKVYVKNKRGKNPEDQPNVVAACWRIRKLLGFVKMKVRRREVSAAPLMHIIICMHACQMIYAFWHLWYQVYTWLTTGGFWLQICA